MRESIFLLLAWVTLSFQLSAQDSTYFYSAGLSGAISSTDSPFWLQSNQFGSVPNHGSYLSGRAGFYRKYNVNNPRFLQCSAGIEGIANLNVRSTAFLTDLYLAGKAGPIEISIGQRREYMGLADSLLTTGSLAMSSNFRPYPKYQISTSNYTNVFPYHDILSFKFSYSDGLLDPADVHFGNVPRVPQVFLHQKSFYIKLGGRHQKLNLFAGFNHQAIWGGEDRIFSGGLKRSSAYEYVILGKPWGGSRVGNHFGTIDLAAEWKGKYWEVFLYRQSIYEDGSLVNLSNVADGLNGLRFRKRTQNRFGFDLKTLLFELVYTKNQGGAVFDMVTGTFGRDNYFNHYVYVQGWSYKGRALGTPLVAPQSQIRDNLATSESAFTSNNRLVAFHLGANATFRETTLLFKGTHSVNSGTYISEYNPPLYQTSLYIQVESPLKVRNNTHLTLSLAADFGQLYPKNTALMLGWRKSGFKR
ncbi:capsule assembly Wzi family protein [Dyadobacter sp. CY323]|uniref:capsule assembly Wzi family protein n=1 Tax=Dyadobacter sp. CY323 TaxID=2907302 RepID=UPI001F40FDB0|nr:capsule assembly Wzi family protein [Dyadobacter sp. CY323]MCE6990971.1 capsule assembly Wzi family protein [Dyadobacter sp. CY323]